MARLLALTVEVPLLLAASMEYKSEKLYKNYEKNIELIKQYTAEAEEIRAKVPEIKVDFKEDLQKNQSRVLEVAAKFAKDRKGNTLKVLDNLLKLSDEMNVVATSSSSRLFDMVQHGESQTADTRHRQEQIRTKQTMILLLGFLANVAAGIALAIFYRINILQRIRRITGNTIALSKGESMQAELKGDDEIALVDKAFHEMNRQLIAASAREKALFDNASDVICVLDADLKFTRVNPVSKQHWGYDPAELLGQKLSVILSADELLRMEKSIAESRSTEQAVSFECGMKTRDDIEKDMLWSLYWSAAESNLYCIVHDVSEQKKLEKAKAQFLTMISSNLKLPLHSIANALKNLVSERSKKMPELAVSKLSTTSTNVQRLVSLVDELLLMNEAEFGKLEIKKEICKVNETLQRAVQDLEALAETKQITLQIDSVDQEWSMDANRIIQVLVNLISNAIKFSSEGSKVVVSTERNSDVLLFKVTDTGRGIPEAQIKNVFEKFAQVQVSDGKRQAGTGLGLPICKQIVEEHGGEIGVDSVDGKGSTFWFRLPQGDAVLVRKTEPALAASSSPSTVAALPQVQPAKKSTSFPGTKLGLTAKGAILVGIPILCELALVACLSVILLQVDRERASELHERLVSNAASTLTIAAVDAQTTMGHEYSERDWKQIQDDMEVIRKTKKELYKLIADSPKELSYLEKSELCFDAITEHYDMARENVEEKNGIFLPFAERHSMIPTLIRLFKNLQNIVEIAESKERLSPTKQQALRQAQWQVLIIGLVGNVVSSVLLAIYFSRDINSRLMLLADNARRLADDEPLNKAVSGADEIAMLDKEFHKMAAALSAARIKERAVFDNSQDIVCILDENAKFLSINPACSRLLGYSKDEFLQNDLLQLSVDDDREKTKKSLTKQVDELQFSLENRIVPKTGGSIDMLWSFSRKRGEPIVYCIGHDITARKQLEQMKQDFLAMVSHDLRTPLTAIHGTTQLTAKAAFGEVAGEELEILQTINTDCRSLVDLISDLLDLEKLEAGKMKLSLEEVELADVLNKSIAACKDREKVKLEYTLELDETVVNADLDRLSQAIGTIIGVAAASSQERVRVRLENKGGKSIIKVFDSATLLSDNQKSGFFQRHDVSSNGDSQNIRAGSRLSLALARCILEHHGGDIAIEAHESGNLFSLSLPRTADVDDQDIT